MTVKAKLYQGLQSRGQTPIDGDFTISKTGTTVDVSSGTFIDTQGNSYTVPATSKDIGTSTSDREIGIWLYDNAGTPDVHIGPDRPNNVIQAFVAPDWFEVPAGTADLSNVEMYAFGWIDQHPAQVMEEVKAQGGTAVKHADIQKLKKNGAELDLGSLTVQKPEKPQSSNTVNVV